MKKKTAYKLPKVSAEQVAKQLKRALGLDKALSVAEYYNKTVGFHGKTNDPLISINDVNKDYVSLKDIRYNANVWRQVYGILAKQN